MPPLAGEWGLQGTPNGTDSRGVRSEDNLLTPWLEDQLVSAALPPLPPVVFLPGTQAVGRGGVALECHFVALEVGEEPSPLGGHG